MSIRHTIIETEQLGQVTLVADGAALSGVYYPGHWTNPDVAAFGPAVSEESDPLLGSAATQLRQYLAGERTEFDVPVVMVGTPFQQRVWELLGRIGYGETTTYGRLAEQLGDRNLARMVGQAVGHNPLSIVVGCHRVLGSTGSLTGYAGGLPRKEFLLTLEGSALAPARLF